MLRVAVVGSGPAGLYTAEALIKQAALLPVPVTIKVDVIDRLPTPYGLVRYGVAPDHKSIKSVANYLRRVLESPDVRFVGGVTLGVDVTREELLAAYDAVVYATGAMRDRRLGIDGEDLPGSYAATDFVNWYCGHPDVDPDAFTLDAESVAVIGVGNVAVDVARILARDPAELEATDIPEPVMDALRASRVREVHVIGRRGPAQAKFTTKELRELGELAGVDVSVPAAEFDLEGGFDRSGESATLAASDRRVRGNLVAMAGWSAAARDPAEPGRQAPAALLAPPGRDREVAGRHGRRPPPGAHPADRERGVRGHRRVRDHRRADGAAQRRLPVGAAARRPVRPEVAHRAQRGRAGAVGDGRAAAGGVRGGLAQARPDRRDRHQQGRRGRDRRSPCWRTWPAAPPRARPRCPAPACSGCPGRPTRPRRPRPTWPTPPSTPPSAWPTRPARPMTPAGAEAAAEVAAEAWALAELLAARGVDHVSYEAWLRVSAAEEELARSLGRGDRVKLPHRDAVWSAARGVASLASRV